MTVEINADTLTRLQAHLEKRHAFYLDLLRQMVEINSFTTNAMGVNKLGRLTAEAFTELGFSVEAIECNVPSTGRHIVLTRPGRTNQQIGLISHLDTVYPPDEELRHNFVWRPAGDRIYGPGTIDIKGGTVMIFMILDALRAVLPQVYNDVTWLVLLNAAEEILSEDFGDLCLQRLQGNTRACLVFETGHIDQQSALVVAARKGMTLYRVEVIGRGAHAGSSHANGANAVVQLARTIEQIDSLTDYKNELTFNVGVIAGGTVINRVPHFAAATGEMRAFSPEVFEEGLKRLLAIPNYADVRSPADGYRCQVEIEILRQTPPWSRNPASDRLLSIWQQTARWLGIRVYPQERGGLSDGNALWAHFPTLDGLGPAGRNAHCSEHSPDGSKEQEYVTPSSFTPKALLNTMSVLRLLQLSDAA